MTIVIKQKKIQKQSCRQYTDISQDIYEKIS